MFVRIRKERAGYILFERFTRQQRVVGLEPALERLLPKELTNFINKEFGVEETNVQFEFISTAPSELELSAPFGMYVEISSTCSLDCTHCYKELLCPYCSVDIASFKHLFERLHQMGVFEIRLCGNEPTILTQYKPRCICLTSKKLCLL